ncbi:MAG: hypothetical protein IPK55_12640 [Streptococcus sp.]|nr:hypothetical protein [Streptococcus sp.]
MVSGDGCSATCTIETGWTYAYTIPTYSVCSAICGDGLKMNPETCDDGGVDGTSMCKSDCTGSVSGWVCTGGSPTTPSTCTSVCGDTFTLGTE